MFDPDAARSRRASPAHGGAGLVADPSHGTHDCRSLRRWRAVLPGRVTAGEHGRGLRVGLAAAGTARGRVAAGAWCAMVGMPAISAEAARDVGVELSRLPLVPDPGARWVEVVGALLDAVDVVVARAPAQLADGDIRRLAARARSRGVVFIPFLAAGARWPGADVRLSAADGVWSGIGSGYGRLRRRRLIVSAEGRGTAAGRRSRRALAADAAGGVGASTRHRQARSLAVPAVAVATPTVARHTGGPDGGPADRAWPRSGARTGRSPPPGRSPSVAGDAPVAVVTANHVVACSTVARDAGVRRGMRRREAQARCPDLVVLPRDEAAEARCFEPVIVGGRVDRPGGRGHPARAGRDRRPRTDPPLRRRDRRWSRRCGRPWAG